ncbi:serine hydrolase [Desnuesiella massiliensis]|uniref:serine hydrolase n=1 Tax=Desnuesiella massiliensis TaxID=1650662 RepID=UPI00241D9A86|nr:serine hydrolase [Desnuesiella massiliensis]
MKQVSSKEENQIKINFNEAPQNKKDDKLIKLEEEIKNYLGSNEDKIGLFYYDINSGNEIDINGDKTFLAASTVKVQMNMVLSDLVQKGAISEEELLQYTEDCYEEGTGVLQGEDLTKPLPLKLLSEYSITHSDNIATNMILKRLDYENFRILVDKKLDHTTDHSENYITAKDEALLLKWLYDNPYNNAYYPQIIENMKNTDFHDRIDLYIPQKIVAHKTGDYDNYVNDVAIVYTKNPYILTIYTEELPNADEVMAEISKIIYEYQINNVF